MIEWSEWSEADAATGWDAALSKLPEPNVYQSFGWGEYKRRSGWLVRRGTVTTDHTPVAMAQCLIRECTPVRLAAVWVPGGPAGEFDACRGLGPLLMSRYGHRGAFLRMNILRETERVHLASWRRSGWCPATTRVGNPATFQIDLTEPLDQLRRRLSGNWRHNLVRGEGRGTHVKIWSSGEPLDPLLRIHDEMCGLQKIPRVFTVASLESLRACLGEALTLVVAYTGDGDPVAVRGYGRVGDRAYELIAAVTASGRRSYANYLLMWRALQLAKEQGVRIFDLSGADAQAAAGVYDFKKGLGGHAVTYVGEWDWSNSTLMRWGINCSIRYRRAGL